MVRVSAPLELASAEGLTLFSVTEPLLSNSPVLVFHGLSSTTNANHSSWRIQTHIFSPAGFQSFPRITASPNSPLYAAVNHLPPEQQGDEVRRGLAIGLLKYFSELPDVVKKALKESANADRGRIHGQFLHLFDDVHAGDLAGRLVKVDNIGEVFKDIQSALDARSISNVDLDVFFPPDFSLCTVGQPDEDLEVGVDEDQTNLRYEAYASLVRLFGSPTFLPTSKLQRAPSRPMTRNRSKSLSVEQEDSIRREMHELVETEERYVGKLDELVSRVAQDFRLNAKLKTFGSTSPDERALQDLFPESLDKILDVNSKFLDAVSEILGRPQIENVWNAKSENNGSSEMSRITQITHEDDILGFSKILILWFPQFADCYGAYMRASAGFPRLLNVFLRDGGSSFSQRVRETGEQKLRAMLIEPVQRLPRYSLFIDNITSNLPLKHPAMQPLLEARDAIANICALQSSPVEQSQTVDRLRNLIASWPSNLRPAGRLISAVDYLEIPSPFRLERVLKEQKGTIFLLFSDYLVSARKSPHGSLTARGIIAEVDRPSKDTLAASVAIATTGQHAAAPLIFNDYYRLSKLRFTESSGGSMVFMTSVNDAQAGQAIAKGLDSPTYDSAAQRAFYLFGSFEGRANKWTEEIAKARIEGRFPEKERESGNWELRTVIVPKCSLTVFAAVTQASGGDEKRRNGVSNTIRVIAYRRDSGGTDELRKMGAVMSVMELRGNVYRMEVRYAEGREVVEEVGSADFAVVFAERLGRLLRQQNVPHDGASTASFLSQNSSILRSLRIQTEPDQNRFRTFRPPSPVKLISNFLSGATAKDPVSPEKSPFPKLGELPPVLSPTRKTSGSRNREHNVDPEMPTSATVLSSRSSKNDSKPFQQLERNLATYIVSLQERRAEIVGSALRGRWGSDERRVQEVHKALLDDQLKQQVLADVPVPVLFAAFEKFLKSTWKDEMGPVVSPEIWTIQDRAGMLLPSAFEKHFKSTLGDMAPQNRRAFKGIISLLADLLDASGNDGDRGALTATFAELLVNEGDPHVYISLLDRLVEDFDLFFEDQKEEIADDESTTREGSIRRMRSFNTGSISSNTSSLRKRFGFHNINRDNSRLETESKVGSVWRTLSKTARGTVANGEGTTPSKVSSLGRSKSTDVNHRMPPPLRPTSQDRPHVLGGFTPEPTPRPQYTPDRHGVDIDRTTPVIRKKRRSSLSDLKSLQDSPAPLSFSPSPRRTPDGRQQKINYSPKTPSPVKLMPRPLNSTNRKENSPLTMSRGERGTLMERPTNIQSEEAYEVAVPSASSMSPTKKSIRSPSGIPSLRGSIRERSGPSSPIQKAPSTTTTTSQRGRMENVSPRKMRDRVLTEHQKAIKQADQGFQAEMMKIGQEISSLGRNQSITNHSSSSSIKPYTGSNSNTTTTNNNNSNTAPTAIAIQRLSTRLTALENRHVSLMTELKRRVDDAIAEREGASSSSSSSSSSLFE